MNSWSLKPRWVIGLQESVKNSHIQILNANYLILVSKIAPPPLLKKVQVTHFVSGQLATTLEPCIIISYDMCVKKYKIKFLFCSRSWQQIICVGDNMCLIM